MIERGEPIDLVFFDVVVPGGMSGIELARTLDQRFPHLPVLLATGHSDAVADAELGVPFVAKPYRPEQLDSLIAQLLAKDGVTRPPANERVG